MILRVIKQPTLLLTILVLIVMVLGAYTRLKQAGLGCPDWPGCYGEMIVPSFDIALHVHPDQPLDYQKAWIEMIHRYVAGTLGVMILIYAIIYSFVRKTGDPLFWRWFVFGLVLCQILLGRLTVTMKLHPFVVMGHLLGGLALVGLLSWITLKEGSVHSLRLPQMKNLRPYYKLGLIFLVVQIALGGWMSANYASLACPDLPTCQGEWLPEMDFSEAFTLWQKGYDTYEGGRLENTARVTIHMLHRLWSVIVFFFLFGVGFLSIQPGRILKIQHLGWCLLIFLCLQMVLGVSNVLLGLPILVAVAHQIIAAILLIIIISLNYYVASAPQVLHPSQKPFL